MKEGDILVCIKEFRWKNEIFYNIGDRCFILNRRLIVSINRYMFNVSHLKYVFLALPLDDLNEYFITNVEHRRRVIDDVIM